MNTRQFKKGDIVRYSGDITALARLDSPHIGGWNASNCIGGGVFVSDFTLATEEDIATAAQSQFAVAWVKDAALRNLRRKQTTWKAHVVCYCLECKQLRGEDC
jgi:hypothetical protein